MKRNPLMNTTGTEIKFLRRGESMRICILTDELIGEFDPGPYMEGFDWEMVTMTDPVLEVLRALDARNEFDVYLNICEGYEIDDLEESDWEYQGIDVVNALEQLNLPYTGASPSFFDPTREEMQAAADAHGVGFAKGYRVTSVEEAQRLVKNLRYPIMVKHPRSYGSTGMFRESRVDAPDQLAKQVERVCSEFGAARMEEFIVGKEFNVWIIRMISRIPLPTHLPSWSSLRGKSSGTRM
jgi:D-alanine-D-alanine ligase